MIKTILKGILIVVCIILVVYIIFFLAGREPTQVQDLREGIFGGETIEPRDIFGEKIGTTTSPTTNLGTPGYPSSPNSDFSDATLGADSGYASTSKTVTLDSFTDIAIFTFKVLNASSSNYYSYDIYGSNDAFCTTTATSTTDNNYDTSGIVPLTSDINWFDIGTDGSRISGSVDDSSPNTTGTPRVLTNLNWSCLMVDLRGASSTVWVQLREKMLK